jgi:hypothetical protein
MVGFYVCQCECGEEAEVRTSNLLFGSSQTCTRCRGRKGLKRGESAANLLIATYKKNATDRNISFKLSSELFFKLTKRRCFYCGCEPAQISRAKSYNGDYVYNGIDRIDSSKGYIKENCVACCKWCNTMKLDHGKQEFLVHVAKIYDRLVRGK